MVAVVADKNKDGVSTEILLFERLEYLANGVVNPLNRSIVAGKQGVQLPGTGGDHEVQKVVRGKLSQAEYMRQKGIVEKHLEPFFGELKLALIRRKDVADYIDSRMGEVSDGTIIKETNVLKHLFTIAWTRN